MIYGQPRLVTDPAERLAGLRAIAEHVAPGQWDYARLPAQPQGTRRRAAAGAAAGGGLGEIGTGPPSDGDTPDAALGLWAGELPLATTWQATDFRPGPAARHPLRLIGSRAAPGPTGVPAASRGGLTRNTRATRNG